MLFRIAFMVDEKKLGPVLSFLSGKVLNMDAPIPVVMADDRAYVEIIDLRGRKKITRQQIKEQIVAAGKPASSLAYAVKQLIASKVIKPNGERGVFVVVGKQGGKRK